MDIGWEGRCAHQQLDLDCPVCRLWMDDADEDWGAVEGPTRTA